MMRITFYIFVVMACFTLTPMHSYAQVVQRDIPPPRVLSIPETLVPPDSQRLRVPDTFFRHENLPDIVRRGDIVPLSVIRKEVLEKYPGRIVDVRLLVPKRDGINYLYDVKVLMKDGKLLSVKVDAKSVQIVDVRG